MIGYTCMNNDQAEIKMISDSNHNKLRLLCPYDHQTEEATFRETALHFAAIGGEVKIIEALLEAKAEVDISLNGVGLFSSLFSSLITIIILTTTARSQCTELDTAYVCKSYGERAFRGCSVGSWGVRHRNHGEKQHHHHTRYTSNNIILITLIKNNNVRSSNKEQQLFICAPKAVAWVLPSGWYWLVPM